MKKNYIIPETTIYRLMSMQLLQTSNPSVDPSQTGNPNDADAPSYFFDDDED